MIMHPWKCERTCEIPICRDCRRALVANRIGEMVLCNDNWYGYVDPFMYANGVTWMEKTCASPYWTGMMLVSIDSRHQNRRKHNLGETMYQHENRIETRAHASRY